MAQPLRIVDLESEAGSPEQASVPRGAKDEAVYQAYLIMRVVFTAVPLVVGCDKFFDLLAMRDARDVDIGNRIDIR